MQTGNAFRLARGAGGLAQDGEIFRVRPIPEGWLRRIGDGKSKRLVILAEGEDRDCVLGETLLYDRCQPWT